MKNSISFLAFCVTFIAAASAQDPSEACAGLDPSQITYVPMDSDCRRYIECFDEVGTLSECSEGLWWHQEIENCDYPGSYCSGWTDEPWTPGPPSSRPNPGPDPRCVDTTTQHWPHPVLCDRFIECFKGNSYEMGCPAGLYFSNTHKDCVNKNESDCCVSKPCEKI